MLTISIKTHILIYPNTLTKCNIMVNILYFQRPNYFLRCSFNLRHIHNFHSTLSPN